MTTSILDARPICKSRRTGRKYYSLGDIIISLYTDFKYIFGNKAAAHNAVTAITQPVSSLDPATSLFYITDTQDSENITKFTLTYGAKLIDSTKISEIDSIDDPEDADYPYQNHVSFISYHPTKRVIKRTHGFSNEEYSDRKYLFDSFTYKVSGIDLDTDEVDNIQYTFDKARNSLTVYELGMLDNILELEHDIDGKNYLSRQEPFSTLKKAEENERKVSKSGRFSVNGITVDIDADTGTITLDSKGAASNSADDYISSLLDIIKGLAAAEDSTLSDKKSSSRRKPSPIDIHPEDDDDDDDRPTIDLSDFFKRK